jgi:hypothetical protein
VVTVGCVKSFLPPSCWLFQILQSHAGNPPCCRRWRLVGNAGGENYETDKESTVPLAITIECEFESKAWNWSVADDGLVLAGASRTLQEAICRVVDAVKTVGESYGRTNGIPNRPDLVYCKEFALPALTHKKVPIQLASRTTPDIFANK